MADTVSQSNPANFAATSSAFPAPTWIPVAITAQDGSGTWHGFQRVADGLIVRRALVTPSAPYLASLATAQTPFSQNTTQIANAKADIQSLRSAITTAAGGGTALTSAQIGHLFVDIIRILNS